jgi:hypothetical protein
MVFVIVWIAVVVGYYLFTVWRVKSFYKRGALRALLVSVLLYVAYAPIRIVSSPDKPDFGMGVSDILAAVATCLAPLGLFMVIAFLEFRIRKMRRGTS